MRPERIFRNKYAEQVVGILSTAGLVKSARGPKGGYRATDRAKISTIGTILRLTESTLKEQDIEIDNLCLNIVFKDLKVAVDEVLDRYTLMQLLEMKQEIIMFFKKDRLGEGWCQFLSRENDYEFTD